MNFEIEVNATSSTPLSDATPFSPRTIENGRLKLVNSKDWTSGFFPGELWMLYKYTHKKEWKNEAETFTARMEKEKTNGGTHDMGFKIYCSFAMDIAWRRTRISKTTSRMNFGSIIKR